MKQLIEKFWADMYEGIMAQDKSKITQHFADGATYAFRTADEMMAVELDELAASCLSYKPTLDQKYSIERVDELADGSWVSIVAASVDKKPYFTVSYFTFDGDKISNLTEYYGDF